MKKFKNIFITSVLAITLLFSCSKIYAKYADDKKAVTTYSELRAQNNETDSKDSNDETKKDLKKDLSSINADFRFWITIDNTELEYPVLQGEDNDFYLKRDINKNASQSGSIYMDYRNDADSYKNLILYGHNMKNGSMFAPVIKYKDKSFWSKNNKIRIYSGPKEYVYEVFDVCVMDPDEYDYLITDFESDKDFLTYVATMRKKSLFKSDLKITADDEIITLSTCSYEFDNARTVVQGKLIEVK